MGGARFQRQDTRLRHRYRQRLGQHGDRRWHTHRSEKRHSSTEPGSSPNGKWTAFVKDDNLWLRSSTEQGDRAIALSTDGKPGDSYQGTGFFWSPDSSKLVAFRTEAAEENKIHIVQSSPKDQVQPKLLTLDYLKPGHKIAHPRPVPFDVKRKKATLLEDALFPMPWSLPALGDSGWGNGITWANDSSRFFFAYNPRGHQLMRVLTVDAATATARTLFEDSSHTFIHYSEKFWADYLPAANEILWMSERDGWNHLYVHDATTGEVKRRLTQGNWPVRCVDSLNEQKGELVLQVMGRNPMEDPYHTHFVRISLKDGKLTPLTGGDGTHQITFSPDGTHYLDTYSRVDLPPITELRRSRDGKKLATLEEGDARQLFATGWKAPERFVAKGRDGRISGGLSGGRPTSTLTKPTP